MGTEVAFVNILGLLILLVAAIIAAIAAYFSYRSVKATEKATVAATLLGCLEQYRLVMKGKREALEKKQEVYCEDFYRELFDLHWSEFHIWKMGMIPDDVMKAWLAIRYRNYMEDAFRFTDATGKEVTISYKDTWNKLNRLNYFEQTDPFVKFMNKAHSEAITDMRKLRKEFTSGD